MSDPRTSTAMDSVATERLTRAKRFVDAQGVHGFTLRELRAFVGLTDREGDAMLRRLKREGYVEYLGGKWWLR